MKISLNQHTILLLAASLPLSTSAFPDAVFIREVDDDYEDGIGNDYGTHAPEPQDNDFLPVPLLEPDLQVKIKKAMDNCEDYTMAFDHIDFMHIQRTGEEHPGLGDPDIKNGMSWGLHALQWKAFKHFGEGGTYNKDFAHDSDPPPPASNSGGGMNHVSSDGADLLDFLERADSGIFKDSEGNPTDPIGTWMSAAEPNALAGAIMAAMNIHYWTTPTYVDTREYRGKGGVAVIEEVTLCVDGLEPPHVACEWDPRGSYASTCEDSSLLLKKIKVARFDGNGVYTDESSPGYHVIDGDDWPNHYGRGDGTMPVLVFDPPAGTSRAEIEALKQQAENIVSDSLIDPAVVTEMINDANAGGSIRGGSGGWN